MSKAEYPLYQALLEQQGTKRHRFHVPAHCVEGGYWYSFDLTELSGLDNLFAPRDCIARAQELAAAVFQADRTYFSVNGSSAGLVAAVSALCRPGDTILLSRHSHRSVGTGLILSGARPLFIPVAVDERGIVSGPTVSQVEAALAACDTLPAAILVTSPNYWGISLDLHSLAACANRAGIPLVVDEAHGGHFIFHPDFPRGAASAGASIWVNSAHKTLGALTPGAYLHVRDNGLVDLERLEAALAMWQSSSPAYPVMLSLDLVRGRLQEHGRALFAGALSLAGRARRRLKKLRRFDLLEQDDLLPEYGLDPLRLTICWDDPAINGFRLYEWLHRVGRIELEMAGPRYLLALINPGLAEQSVAALVEALGRFQDESALSCKPAPAVSGHYPLPRQRMTPREAFDAPAVCIPLLEAGGKISAQLVTPFPPGVPVLYPGEEITPEFIERLSADLKAGFNFQELPSERPVSIRVVSA